MIQRLFAALLLALSLASVPGMSGAAVDPWAFDDPEKEATYKRLIEELRCTVCQNQNLADSNAELAVDLRRKVKEMVAAGKGHEEVTDYMVARYGDFVLYRPPVKSTTWLLWFGPVLLFIVAAVVLGNVIRRRAATPDDAPLSEEERKRAEALLQDKES